MAFSRNSRNTRDNKTPLEYIYSGSTYREVNKEKVEDAKEEWQLAITLPVETEKGQHPLETMIQKLTEILDTNGDLGARIVFYVSPRGNKRTGEEFAATSILVQPKLKSKQGSRSGGGFRGRASGGGRRDYPPTQPARGRTREEPQEEEQEAPASRVVKPAAKTAPKTVLKKAPTQEEEGPPEYMHIEDENVPL